MPRARRNVELYRDSAALRMHGPWLPKYNVLRRSGCRQDVFRTLTSVFFNVVIFYAWLRSRPSSVGFQAQQSAWTR